jgi:hypothetical protein
MIMETLLHLINGAVNVKGMRLARQEDVFGNRVCGAEGRE